MDYDVTDITETETQSYREKKINQAVLSRIQRGETISMADLDDMDEQKDDNDNDDAAAAVSSTQQPSGAWAGGPLRR